MKSVKIESVKEFMSVLLSADTFDDFFVMDAEIRTFITTKINGSLHKDWMEENEGDGDEEKQKKNGFVSWKQVRPIVYDLVKGKKTPSALVINFIKWMGNGDKGVLRVQYINGELNLISAYQAAEFSLNKEAEAMWDERCAEWLTKEKVFIQDKEKV